MGSLGEHAKGQQPMLDQVRQHIAEYNARAIQTRRNAPLWRRALALLPNPKGPLYRWESRQWNGKP